MEDIRLPQPAARRVAWGTMAIVSLVVMGLLAAACSEPAGGSVPPVTPTTPVLITPIATQEPIRSESTAYPTPPNTTPPNTVPKNARVVAMKSQPAQRPVAVVVDNDRRARPQSSLSQADVIYEAVAEFDLTRLVAVFTDGEAETVGPVRSSRAYHAAIAAEFEAALAHCLSVPTVAQVIAATKVVNLDGCQVQNPQGFWRDSDRYAPFNLYVDLPTLQKVAQGKGTYGALGEREQWTQAEAPITTIHFTYPETHPVEWRYDPEREEYLRWQEHSEHVDMSGSQISARVVLLQFVEVAESAYYGERGYHELTLTGEGEAVLYATGQRREVTWRRVKLTSPTHFFDANENEVVLPPGKVFVQLLAKGTAVGEE